MFYGVINESYDYTEYLEMELENSLLFFKSLDIVQESGIILESAWDTIKTKIKDAWRKLKEWFQQLWMKIKNIFTKKKNRIEAVKELNDKIQKAEPKKDQSTDNENQAENFTWYAPITGEIDKMKKTFSGKSMDPRESEISSGQFTDENVDKYINKCKAISNAYNNYNLDELFENMVVDRKGKSTDFLKNTADRIYKASDQLQKYATEFEKHMSVIDKTINNAEKEFSKYIEKADPKTNTVKAPDGKGRMSVNKYTQMTSEVLNSLKSEAKFYARLVNTMQNKIDSNMQCIIKDITKSFDVGDTAEHIRKSFSRQLNY